jgi:NAD(P)-dependent dehydrogenase (short-subunit alcohol dehydrogenase family)
MGNQRFRGKRVVVTGSGTGIGRGLALAFAREGADVALHFAHSDAGAREAVKDIQQRNGKAEAFQADFRNTEEVLNFMDRAAEFLGGIDVLINNSGITMNKPFDEVTVDQFDTLYNVNIRAMFFATQRAATVMTRQKKGAVINLTSVHAFHGMTEHSVYAGTKGAIVAFTRAVALELIQKGIRVNAIAPGWILVENHLKLLDDHQIENNRQSIPAGIIGKPDDVAELAMFLASDQARYIVGQTYTIDGGQMCIMPLTGDIREKRKVQFGKGYVDV